MNCISLVLIGGQGEIGTCQFKGGISDEFGEHNRKFNGWKEELFGCKCSLRRGICWIVAAGNIREVEGGVRTEWLEQSKDVSKYSVCGPVPTSPIFPAVDDSQVVTVNPEVLAQGRDPELNDGADEQFKSNCLGPPDVLSTIKGAPVWE
jgi:hypothetical protein